MWDQNQGTLKKKLRSETKLKFYKTAIATALLYGTEINTRKRTLENAIQASEMKF